MGFSAAAALASSVTFTTTAGFTFATFGSIAVKFALGAALNALMPKPDIGGNRGYQVNSKGAALDHQIVYGKVRVGGAILYDEATGTKNDYLHRIIAVAGHQIQSFDRIYINDAYVDVSNIDANGNVSSVTLSDGTSSDRYDGKLRIKFHLGASNQAADTNLVSESDGLWTSAHRLRGIAYMYVRIKFDADVYPNGVPTFTATIKGKKVYNPSSGLTVWSDNPALCLRDYLTSNYGLAEDADNIDDTLVNTAVNICNQTNTGAGTTRYTCNGSFTTASSPFDIINNLLTSMGGSLWYAQGKWRMKPAYWTNPVLTLDESDLRSSISLSTRHSRRDNFNIVKGTFRGEESDWQTTDYPQVDSPASIAADNGQESVADINLPFTDNSIEARRLGRIVLERNRQQLTITAAFGLNLMQVQVGDNIRLNNSRFGWTNKEFEVISWDFGLTDGLDLQVNLTLRETAESVFDEVDDGAAYERDNGNLPDAFGGLIVNNLSAQDSGRLQGDGSFVNSVILNWDAADNSFVSHYEVQWKPTSDAAYFSTTATVNSVELSPIVDAIQYTFRVRAISFAGNGGPFATITHTAGGDTTAPARPTGVTADGSFKYVTIGWTNPADLDLSFVEIYENTSNNSAGAYLVGTSSGDNFVRPNLGLDQTFYYFLKSVDYSGNKSGFTAGVSATTTFLDDPDFANGIYSLFTEQGLYAIRDVTSLPASGAFVGEKVFNRTDGRLYQWTGSVWEDVVGGAEDFSDLEGAIAGAQIPDGLIDTLKLANDAVSNAKIAVDAIQGDVIAAGAITETKIGSNAITTSKISAGAITASELAANSVTATQIAANSITASEIAAGAITADEIAANAITAAKITAGAIIADKIAAGTITGDKIGANQITGNNINGQTITGNKIVANTITGGLIAASGIITNSAQINNSVITNAKIDNLAVTTIKIANQAVSNTGADSGVAAVGGYTTVASVSLSTGGGQTIVNVAGEFLFGGVGGEGSSYNGAWRILKGSTVIDSGNLSGEGNLTVPFSGLALTTSGSGTTTITLQCARAGLGDNTVIATATLVTTELKK